MTGMGRAAMPTPAAEPKAAAGDDRRVRRGLPDFFSVESTCSNCGARFRSQARDGANLCPVCWAHLVEAARSSLDPERRCA